MQTSEAPSAGAKAESRPTEVNDGVINHASAWLSGTAIAYYRVCGRWPRDWSEMAQSGLCQVALVSHEGQPIDPDDGRIDFTGDCLYEFAGPPCSPLMTVCIDFESGKTRQTELPPPPTYEQMFSYFTPGSGVDQRREEYLGDTDRLKLWAIVGLIRGSMYMYRELYGDYPRTLAEFLSSGIGGVDADSINPLTGEVFHGDGRANDIYYEYIDLPDVVPTIMPMDADGKRCRAEMSY